VIGSNIGFSLAFLAGVASFLSPCVFSLVPAYIGYLGGRSAASSRSMNENRWFTFSHGAAFVFGFSIVFILLGITASALGGLLYDVRSYLAKIGGVVVVLFGLHMTHLFRIPLLEFDLRHQSIPHKGGGYIASVLLGIFFSAGWSPCVGPVLGAILTISLSGGSITKGTWLLAAYSAGLAVPFLIAALGVGWVTTIIRRYGKVMYYTEKIMGVILVIVGLMLFLGTFESLARFGAFIDFGL
jgi:cytochrome c-type biogenesis protein